MATLKLLLAASINCGRQPILVPVTCRKAFATYLTIKAPNPTGYNFPFVLKQTFNINFSPVRLAGHAKWQNIKSTKTANDQEKSRRCYRYVQLVRRAIMQNNRQTDPKLNRALQDVLTEAQKMNVPKATLDRAIERTKNLKILSFTIEIEGPGKSSLIVKCEGDSVNTVRRDVKKALKKFSANVMPNDSLIKMFKSQGVIRTAAKTMDGVNIDIDAAEEAAINVNAEEVSLEINEDVEDEEFSKAFVFITHYENVNHCKGGLEKQKFKVLSCETELVPYSKIDFGEDISEDVAEIIHTLKDLQEVVAIYTNVA